MLLLPLVLRAFDTEDVAIWLLFGAVINLQVVGNLGFGQTFSRAFANAEGGASIAVIRDLRVRLADGRRDAHCRTDVLERLIGTLRPVYLRLALLTFAGLASVGSASLAKPIVSSSNSMEAWMAWFLVVISTSISVWGNSYASYLLGRNRVALVQRWDMLFGMGGLLTALVAIWSGGGLLELTLAQQAWAVAVVFRNRWLCHLDAVFRSGSRRTFDSEVLAALWPSAWRSGAGVLMSLGVVQASGLAYASLGESADVASYLLGLRMIQVISQISQAPFYSKIPALARMRAEGRSAEQLALAARGMRFSHITFAVGFLTAGIVMEQALDVIGSSAEFVGWALWGCLGLAFFAERAGAMHLQLYSTTNHIVWHVANGVTGVLMVTGAFVLYPVLQIFAFPLAMLLSYAVAYCPIAYFYSYRTFHMQFRSFELPVTVLPLVVAVAAWLAMGLV